MHIGVIVDNEFDNDHRVQKEVRMLKAEGHVVSVLCFDFGGDYNTYKDVNVVRIRIRKKIKDVLVLLSTNFSFYESLWKRHISKFVKTYNIDAIHVHDLYLAKAGRQGIAKHSSYILMVLDLHENYPAAINSYRWATKGWRKFIVQPQKWYRKEEKYLLYADKLIVLSNAFKHNLVQRFPSLKNNPIAVHPNMPDIESFQNFEKEDYTVKFESTLPTLFYFGVVAKRRGIIDILPWIKSVLESGKKFHTLIIGPVDKADKSNFNNYLNTPILKQYTTYIPWENVKYLPAYLKKIEIGLAPFEVNAQHDSGVANKLFQYMYGEIPILATKSKAQKDLIEGANCGLLYDAEEDFKNQLSLLIEDKNLRKELGRNGKKKLLELYKNKADRQFLKIYDY